MQCGPQGCKSKLTVLLGGSIGALTGAAMDTDDAVLGASMLEQIIGKLEEGDFALICLAKLEMRQQKKAENKQKVEDQRNKIKAKFEGFKAKHKKDKAEDCV